MARRGDGQGKGRSGHMICSQCQETGHNMRTCPVVPYEKGRACTCTKLGCNHKDRLSRVIKCLVMDRRPLVCRALETRDQYENAKHCDAASVRRKSNLRNEGDDTRSGETIRKVG